MTNTKRPTTASAGKRLATSKKENGVLARGGQTKRSRYLRTKMAEKPRNHKVIIDISHTLEQAKARDDSLRALERYKRPNADGTFGIVKRSNKLYQLMQEVEAMVEGFKGKVDVIAKEFEALRDDIDEHVLKYDALEQDHAMALECVQEEKETAAKYAGWLANAEKQLEVLTNTIPDEHLLVSAGSSQAKVF